VSTDVRGFSVRTPSCFNHDGLIINNRLSDDDFFVRILSLSINFRMKRKTRAERRSLITPIFQAFNHLLNYAV